MKKIKTPIVYYGGKQTMLKHIRPLIPVHTLYCEPFAGGAAVFFAKEPSKVNVINDLNGELINFYQTVVSDFESLKFEIEKTLHSRLQFDHAWYVYNHPHYFSKVQRAWAVFMLSKMGFAGQISAAFGFDKSECRHSRKMQNAKIDFDIDLKSILEKATIECDDAFTIIKRYDCEGAWHFIDPPYVGSNMGHYSGMFNEENLRDLLEMLSIIKGKFMLTMYPNDLIEEYSNRLGWTIHRVVRTVSACRVGRRKQEEWMIMNY